MLIIDENADRFYAINAKEYCFICIQ